MERELPEWTLGVINKRLSWNQHLGDDNPVAIRAFEKYEERVKLGSPVISTEDEKERDWREATEEVVEEYASELMSQLA